MKIIWWWFHFNYALLTHATTTKFKRWRFSSNRDMPFQCVDALKLFQCTDSLADIVYRRTVKKKKTKRDQHSQPKELHNLTKYFNFNWSYSQNSDNLIVDIIDIAVKFNHQRSKHKAIPINISALHKVKIKAFPVTVS